jgi:7-cyano-7-deazaguanine reductase
MNKATDDQPRGSAPDPDLTLLGRPVKGPVRKLESVPNTHPDRRYTVTLVCPEFTCLCPITGQPDFARGHCHHR